MQKTIYLEIGITGKQLKRFLHAQGKNYNRMLKQSENTPAPRTQIRKRTLSQDSFLAQKIFKQINS